MKIKILAFLLTFSSLVSANDYWSICGTKSPPMDTKIKVTVPIGHTIAGGDGISYAISAISEEGGCIFASTGRSSVSIPCAVGKTVVLRQSASFPALRIKVLSVNIEEGTVVINLTKFLPTLKGPERILTAEAE